MDTWLPDDEHNEILCGPSNNGFPYDLNKVDWFSSHKPVKKSNLSFNPFGLISVVLKMPATPFPYQDSDRS